MNTNGRARFKLGFRNKSAEDRVDICRQTINGFKKAPVANLKLVKLDDLEAQLAAIEGELALIASLRAQLRAALRQRNGSVTALCQSVTYSAVGYKATVGLGGVELLAGGLRLAAPWHRLQAPEAPTNPQGARAGEAGSVVLRWKRTVRRSVFAVQVTTDPGVQTGWTHLLTATVAKCVVKDLEPGRLHWFRMAEVNARGQSPWSQPVPVRPG